MKKVLFALLLTVILCGLPGCTSSRVAVKTETEKQTRQTVAADTSRTEKVTATQQLTAALSSTEQQNVVIEFEEWEYYPAPNDTTRKGSTETPEYNRRTAGEADKPPNAGAVKRQKKGTITINGTKETTGKTEQTAMIQTDAQETGSSKATIDESEKTKASSKKDSRKAYVWIAVGLLLAAIFVGIGIYLARRK